MSELLIKPGLMLALTKGRVLSDQLALLAALDIKPAEDVAASRKLVFDTNRADLKLMVLRGADVATYVEHGIADLGMAGKDVLLEHGGAGFYEPLDLCIGQCRLVEAGLVDEPPLPARIRVATKFVNTAKRYYGVQGRQVDVIRLYGAMELAPLSGLAHRIIDIVETGNTLKENGLQAVELIENISTRLIVNQIAQKTKHDVIRPLVESLQPLVEKSLQRSLKES
ncbi:MAG: ATP phosphoribosyltransferase [Pseudomonadales bacterium]